MRQCLDENNKSRMNLKKKRVKDYLFLISVFFFTQILCNLIFKCLWSTTRGLFLDVIVGPHELCPSTSGLRSIEALLSSMPVHPLAHRPHGTTVSVTEVQQKI